MIQPPVKEHVLALEEVVWTDPERMSGAPCFTNTRVPIQTLFDYIEGGDTLDDFLDGFPGVSRTQAGPPSASGKIA